jgi:Na+:H+ antiporter, NhaA family
MVIDPLRRAYLRRPIARILEPFQHFIHVQASGGITLLVCTVAALVWANSAWSASYDDLLHTSLRVGFGDFYFDRQVEFWINDFLMSMFFFVVGLEIKRELLVGKLSSPRNALLPVVAALGGVLVPAGLYVMLNTGGPGMAGWGIPMATDIAFALGIMALVGSGAPPGLTIFLAALAIVDDLAAVMVIAIFYTEQISLPALGTAVFIFLVMLAANVGGVRNPWVFFGIGGLMWMALVASGVHATLAGVFGALAIPSRMLINQDEFVNVGRTLLGEFERSRPPGEPVLYIPFEGSAPVSIFKSERQFAIVEALETACLYVQAPLQRLERRLHPWVAFVVMPVFALANAGIRLDESLGEALSQPVAQGVTIGLVLGKPVGITLFSWLAVRLRWANLPEGVRWSHLIAVACLAGIGFTMSLFIAALAFSNPELVAQSKVGILTGSLLSVLIGGGLLRWSMRRG